MTNATNLRHLRTSLHITIRELCNRAGISEGYYRMIERGARKPTVMVMEEILIAMDLDHRTIGTAVTGGGYTFECVRGRTNLETDNQLLTEIRDLLQQVVTLLEKGNS